VCFGEVGVRAQVWVKLSEGVYGLGFLDEGGENALLFTVGLAVNSVKSGGVGGQVKVAGYYDYVAEASEAIHVLCNFV